MDARVVEGARGADEAVFDVVERAFLAEQDEPKNRS